jgi:hypothetical protein
MLSKSSGFVLRLVIASSVLAIALTTSVTAQPPATGLGQSWPNATDVSVSPHYHVYVFVRDGIRYIQVNDLSGTVRAAFAEADKEVLVLPIGSDAPYVTTSLLSATTKSENTSATETVYSDSATQVTATPQSNGVVALDIARPGTCTTPAECAGSEVAPGVIGSSNN